jgi:adenylate cyclase
LWDAYYFHARIYMTQGKLEEAVPLYAKASEVQPDDYQSLNLMGTCLRGLGRVEEARALAPRALAVIEKHLEFHPDDVRAVYFASGQWSTLGNREKALEWSRRALVMAPDAPDVRYNVACTYIDQGLLEEALDLLEKNVASGWGNLEWLENDPDMIPLLEHPRFVALLKKMPARQAGANG